MLHRGYCLPALAWTVAALAWSGPAARAGASTVYGEGITLSEGVSVADLLADPDSWVGQRVRVEGRVTDVSAKGGSWIAIAGESTGSEAPTIRFEVADGDITFPVDVKGRRVMAEGELVRLELDRKAAEARSRRLAEEKGVPFDPATVQGPATVYELRGSGAVVF
jgi:hypothetical protein